MVRVAVSFPLPSGIKRVAVMSKPPRAFRTYWMKNAN
jgi:hypothetical protein